MKKIAFYSALLQELEKIYTRFVLTVLHIRMDRYQQQAIQSNSPASHDIKSNLLACINTISHRAQNEPELSRTYDPHKHADTSSITAAMGDPDGAGIQGINKANLGELTKYFKARSNGAELHPGIEARLEQSTWDHIHAAIRCARRADSSHAKMHANIASSACKELAHYLPKERYQEFIKEIEKQMEILKHA